MNWRSGKSEQFRQATSDEKLKELFGIFTRLGPMKSYDGATGDANMAMFSGTGFQVTARYVVEATFQNAQSGDPGRSQPSRRRVENRWLPRRLASL